MKRPGLIKILLLLQSMFVAQLLSAQFAIISDKDGHCYVRSSAELANNVTDTLENGYFVFGFESKGNWIYINYTKNKQELNGYVYHDRLKAISDYEEIPSLKEDANTVTYGKDSIKIIVAEQKFNKSKYRVSYYKEAPDQIELINGKQYWGRDGGQPNTEYKSITIVIGKRKINLPKIALENLFEPSLSQTEVNYDRKNDILYIQSMNSDGAGAYGVIWKIEKCTYKNRYVVYGF